MEPKFIIRQSLTKDDVRQFCTDLLKKSKFMPFIKVAQILVILICLFEYALYFFLVLHNVYRMDFFVLFLMTTLLFIFALKCRQFGYYRLLFAAFIKKTKQKLTPEQVEAYRIFNFYDTHMECLGRGTVSYDHFSFEEKTDRFYLKFRKVEMIVKFSDIVEGSLDDFRDFMNEKAQNA